MKIIPQFYGNEIRYLFDLENEREYARIAAGILWPGPRAGILVVVAEDRHVLPGTTARKIYVLAHYEDEYLESLLLKCLEFMETSSVSIFVGDTANEPAMSYLRQFNERRRKTFHIISGFSFTYNTNVLRRLLAQKYIGFENEEGNSLKARLWEIPSEKVSTASPYDYPAVAALGFVAGYLDMFGPEAEFFRDKGDRDYYDHDALRWGLKR